MNEYAGKNIVVLGLAKSGTTIARILKSLGANVIVNDAKIEEKCIEKKELEQLGIKVICGGHPDDLMDKTTDLVVKNPGIPYDIKPIETAIAYQIPVVTEVEIAYQLTNTPFIGITGSNGKTTTTTLIGEVLNEASMAPVVAGNIGTVLSEKAMNTKEDEVLVTELSSFQLKGTKVFRPHIGVLLNIYPAHLDYHQTIEDYIQSKAKLFKNQTENDIAILNADCNECIHLVGQLKSQIYFFSATKVVEKGAYIEDGVICWKNHQTIDTVLPVEEVLLKGNHNLENILAAIAATILHGASIEAIQHALRKFRGVEHRLEYVTKTKHGITFFNDSKATNPQATITALKSFHTPVILIAGGLDRGTLFKELEVPFREHIKALITYGQTSEKLSEVAKSAGIEAIYTVDNVTEAVTVSSSIAKKGEVVLLSPACASWDMFSSFEERGRMFKEAVHRL